VTIGATAAICGLSAAPALAAADAPRAPTPWSAPIALPTSSTAAPVLTFTADGHAIAGSASSATTRGAVVAAKPGTTRFTTIGTGDLVDTPATYGRDDVAYLRTAVPTNLKVADLGVSLGSASSLGRFQQLARLNISQSGEVTARIAADPHGDVAVVWLAPSGSQTVVRFALRPAGHAFEPTTTLGVYSGADYGSPPLDVAYGSNGDLVVVFQGTSEVGHANTKTLRIVARVKRAGGKFGPLTVIGPAQGSTSLATAVAPNGRAVIGWGTALSGGTNLDGTWTVRAALLAPHAKSFASAQLLDPGGVVDEPNTGVKVAIGTSGTATVAWSGVTVEPEPVDQGFVRPARVATAGPTARFGPTTQLARDAAVFGVVSAGNGTTTILLGPLSDLGNTIDQILATRRPAGASSFSAPEAVSAPEFLTSGATLAVNPHTRGLAALWLGNPSLQPGAPENPPAPVTAQYSTRGA
jgi:hypothetical protein